MTDASCRLRQHAKGGFPALKAMQAAPFWVWSREPLPTGCYKEEAQSLRPLSLPQDGGLPLLLSQLQFNTYGRQNSEVTPRTPALVQMPGAMLSP